MDHHHLHIGHLPQSNTFSHRQWGVPTVPCNQVLSWGGISPKSMLTKPSVSTSNLHPELYRHNRRYLHPMQQFQIAIEFRLDQRHQHLHLGVQQGPVLLL